MEQSQEDGIQIGLRRGRKEGREEGMKEGIQQGVLSVAKELKEQGVPIEIIEKSTHLSPSEIEKL